MANVKRNDIFSRMIKFMQSVWNRLGEPDIEGAIVLDDLDPATKRAVAKLTEAQNTVHAGKSFVQPVTTDSKKALKVAQQRAKTGRNDQRMLGNA